MQLTLSLMVGLGIVAGALAWRSQTRRMRWRSLIFDESPTGVSVKDYHRRRISRARVRRFATTAGCAVLGVAAGLLISLFFVR
jgi:hypothetical protein